jgi:ech hydrogenase subunit D
MNEQRKVFIETTELLHKVKKLAHDGYRLVQISCTHSKFFELTYSFDQDYELINLRINLLNDKIPVPSITSVYSAAFIYENEIHDLFGLIIEGMVPDFKGRLYRMAVKTPFNDGPYKGQEVK